MISAPPASTLYLLGPTASGKSAVAVRLAEALGGEIVNADAFQLFTGLNVLTAQPDAGDFHRARHHLYSPLPLTESCDAQRYRSLALPILADIAARGRIPIVTGGSGLYVKALTHGLDPLPPGDPAVRAELHATPLEEKVRRLLQLDPDAATNVPLSNPRYVERALEICLLTGQPQSALRRSFSATEPSLKGRGFLLDWPRADLYARINSRVERMLADGALAEVAAASPISATAAKAIGFRELRAHLDGQLPLDDAISAIQQATRRYAKRQLTWFRREAWLQTICLPADCAPDCAADTFCRLICAQLHA